MFPICTVDSYEFLEAFFMNFRDAYTVADSNLLLSQERLNLIHRAQC